MLLQELARKIRSRREARGLKQQDVANALHVSPQAVSKWERGENAPDIAILEPLARLLDVTTDWLLCAEESREVFEATVFVSGVREVFRKSRGMKPRDFATWANGLFYGLTEATVQCGGVPVKYMGDQYLCFFSGANHAARALDMAARAKAVAREDLCIGLSTGEIHLGSVGHPDYAHPDIMGEAVNAAFVALQWADAATNSGLAACASVLARLAQPIQRGKEEKLEVAGSDGALRLIEVIGLEERPAG